MNSDTQYIAKFAKVSIEEAIKIHEVIDSQWLVDWSEDSYRKVNKAIKLAQAYIANGMSWEVKA